MMNHDLLSPYGPLLVHVRLPPATPQLDNLSHYRLVK